MWKTTERILLYPDATINISVTLTLAGELGSGTFDELVGNTVGLVLGKTEEGADGADGEMAVGAAIVRQPQYDV